VVEDAFAAYLRGLAEIARLEIVSVWADPDPHNVESNTLHVIGRDHNAPRNYYYRRFTHRRWTPWEPVGAQIEGDDVLAVVYRRRLHIFWVTTLIKAVEPMTGNKKISELAGEKPDAFKLYDVQAQLHWTELVSGQWTRRASSDLLTIATQVRDVPVDEGRAWAVKNIDADGRETSVSIRLQYWLSGKEPVLHFVSRQGRPSAQIEPWVDPPSSLSPLLLLYARPDRLDGPLWLDAAPFADDAVLNQRRPAAVVQAPVPAPVDSPAISRLVNPFFYADRQDPSSPDNVLSQNTFFVQPHPTVATWVEYEGSFVPAVTKTGHTVETVLQLTVEATTPTPMRVLSTGQAIVIPEDHVDETARFSLRKPADWATGGDAPIPVGRRLVNATGATAAAAGTRRS
jgi:hypothetical protein